MAKIICIATPLYPPQIGGPATHVSFVERGLSKFFDLRVVTFSDVLSYPKGIKHVVYFCKVFVSALHAECVYALDPVSVGLPAAISAWLLRKPFVLRVGGDYAWEQGVQRFGVEEPLDAFVKNRQSSLYVRLLQGVQAYVARSAHTVVVPSEYLGRIVRTWGVSSDRILVIYSQPELEPTMSRAEARKKLGLHENEIVLLSAGRIVPWKGFEGVIDALVSLLPQREMKLYIAGSGPHLPVLLTHIEKMKATNHVVMLGQLPKNVLHMWLSASDVFLLNTQYEGLSHLILEAFAAHVPVVTTRVGGNSELVEDGKTGVLVAPDDIAALSAALSRVLSDRVHAQTLTEQAAGSLSKFNPDVALRSLRSLFETI